MIHEISLGLSSASFSVFTSTLVTKLKSTPTSDVVASFFLLDPELALAALLELCQLGQGVKGQIARTGLFILGEVFTSPFNMPLSFTFEANIFGASWAMLVWRESFYSIPFKHISAVRTWAEMIESCVLFNE
ncbi:unnamed protein product [Moneuplotes crassus]|uniref:Uncharacterized protein n=1 Tax=Euplotes crassus TaxID=5936 RepID=A0AAD1UC75_EUPCR|nr:unnamed protein product [Moneuplotes crassus]